MFFSRVILRGYQATCARVLFSAPATGRKRLTTRPRHTSHRKALVRAIFGAFAHAHGDERSFGTSLQTNQMIVCLSRIRW